MGAGWMEWGLYVIDGWAGSGVVSDGLKSTGLGLVDLVDGLREVKLQQRAYLVLFYWLTGVADYCYATYATLLICLTGCIMR